MIIKGKRSEFNDFCRICTNRVKNITGECSPSSTLMYCCSFSNIRQGQYYTTEDIIECSKYQLDNQLVLDIRSK